MKITSLTIVALVVGMFAAEALDSSISHSQMLPSESVSSPLFGSIVEVATAKNEGLCPPGEVDAGALVAMHEDHRSKALHFNLEAPNAPQVGQVPTCTVACTYICTIECTYYCTAQCTWQCTGQCTYECTDPCTEWCTYWCTNEETCDATICGFTTPGGIFQAQSGGVMQGEVERECVVPCTKACTYICTGECTYECTGHCTYDCTFECTYTCTGQCTYPCTNFCTQQ